MLLIFWEVVPKYSSDGKMLQEIILVCDAYRKVSDLFLWLLLTIGTKTFPFETGSYIFVCRNLKGWLSVTVFSSFVVSSRRICNIQMNLFADQHWGFCASSKKRSFWNRWCHQSGPAWNTDTRTWGETQCLPSTRFTGTFLSYSQVLPSHSESWHLASGNWSVKHDACGIGTHAPALLAERAVPCGRKSDCNGLVYHRIRL